MSPYFLPECLPFGSVLLLRRHFDAGPHLLADHEREFGIGLDADDAFASAGVVHLIGLKRRTSPPREPLRHPFAGAGPLLSAAGRLVVRRHALARLDHI